MYSCNLIKLVNWISTGLLCISFTPTISSGITFPMGFIPEVGWLMMTLVPLMGLIKCDTWVDYGKDKMCQDNRKDAYYSKSTTITVEPTLSGHPWKKASFDIKGRSQMNSLCTKQPLNKGHLRTKAKTLFLKGVRYRGLSLYTVLLWNAKNNYVCEMR